MIGGWGNRDESEIQPPKSEIHLASLKNLAGQTIWYGLSTIAARLIGFLLTPLITYLLNSKYGTQQFGEYSTVMAAVPFVNVVFTYGMETAYFRFSNSEMDQDRLFRTSFSSIIVSTTVLSLFLVLLRHPIARFFDLASHPEYITWTVLVIALDTLSVIPFAKLRQENRPRRYAFTKIAGILVNISCVVWLLALSPAYVTSHPDSAYAHWYGRYTSTGFLLMAFLAQSAFTLLLLAREWLRFRFQLDVALWRTVLAYALPFVVVGLGGMVNETIDRIMLQKLYSGTQEAAKTQVGIYSANYKIAIFISLFIQAFRMAAEPFFFRQAADKNAPNTYAKVMKWFVITLCFAFLFTALFLDVWQYMVGSEYRGGLGVVPILLYANLALGIYYNLSVWYKISGHLNYGMGITLFGAALTLIINYLLIPSFGKDAMYVCAWTTFICYASMMILSYYFGQKYFPVPYAMKKLLTFIGAMTILFFIQQGVRYLSHSFVINLISGIVLMLAFVALIWVAERKELKAFPVIGKFIR